MNFLLRFLGHLSQFGHQQVPGFHFEGGNQTSEVIPPLEIVVNIFLQFDCTEVTQHVAYYYCVLLSHNKLQLSDFQLLLLYTAVPNKQPAAHKKQLGNKYCLRLIMSHI